jgi:DNA-binding response OmpR family regulator
MSLPAQVPATVLVVEATPTAANQLSAMLTQRLGPRIRVIATVSATEAMQLADNQAIALVLAHVHCGEGDGLALCRALRAMPGGADVPIILLNERATARDKIAGFTSGADDYLVRPIDDRLLIARIELLWRIKYMERLHA